MSDLRDLYQELILDHGKHPRNFKIIDGVDHLANGHNPLCGDKVTIMVRLKGDIVEDIGFQGSGCAICMAAASTMTEAIKGKPVSEVQSLFDEFVGMLIGGGGDAEAKLPLKLSVFSGVKEYPVRVKCATLAWHTLKTALSGGAVTTTTE